MDSRTYVSLLIQKLKDLRTKETITANPSFVREVQKAIDDLQLLLKQIQSLQVSEEQAQVLSVLPAVYFAKDIIDSLLTRKEFQLRPTRKGEINGFKKMFQCHFACFRSSHSQDLFTLQMEKLRNDHLLEKKEAGTVNDIEQVLLGFNTDAESIFFLNEERRQRWQQLWERSFENHLKGEESFVVLQQQSDELVGRLIPKERSIPKKKKREVSLEQDSNDSSNQSKAVDGVAGVDSGTTNQYHSDGPQPPVPHSSDHPPQEIVEANSKRDSDNTSNRGVFSEIREETDNHGDGYQSSFHQSDEAEEGLFETANNGDSTYEVVTVIGAAGSGKSTFVRKVYNRIDVKRHFAERAWVSVSSEAKARDILLSILKQTKKGMSNLEMEETLSEEELTRILKKCLEDTNYLIVIEDVETPKVWRDVRHALNFHCSRNKSSGRHGKLNHGGKILITSREDNATWYAEDSTLRISQLNDDESWKLFSEKVQFAEDGAVKRQLEDKILELCGRLPLGIVLLAGLLSTKEVTDCSRVIEIANRSLGGDRLVLLCYQDLPSEVKSCFLYMALFPKEYEIPVRRLIHLWCAEGFVTPSNSDEMVIEDRAELYLQELVIRNMIKVRWRLDGRPIACRMHDHLHDIFSQRAVDEGFFYLEQLQSSHASVKQPKVVRRLASAYHGNNKFPSSFIELGNLRSSIVFDSRVHGTAATEVNRLLKKIIGKRDFGLLKVLDLEGVYKPNISGAVEKLTLLSYLGLRSTFIHSLPDSVGNLSYLETLDLKHTKIRKLPSSLWKAKRLQHLYLSCVHSQAVSSSLSESLSNLRTLWGLRIKDDSHGQCDDFLRNLTRLRKLGLTCLSASSLKIIAQLTELQSLKVKYIEKDSGSQLQLQSMEKNEKLREVYLMGKLEKSVIEVRFLPRSLRVLTLCESGLKNDPMPVLGLLKELSILRLLKGSYKGEKMCCHSGGFPKLHNMELWDLAIREGWTLERGAMPCLRVLEISRCDFRERYDESHPQQMTGLQNLTALKELVLIDMKHLGKKVKESLKELEIKNVHIIERK